MKKSVVSLILVFAMLFTSFPVSVFSVTQQSNDTASNTNAEADAQIEQTDLAFESDNSFGNIISNAMEEKQDVQEEESDNYIIDLSVENNVADVSLVVEDDSIVRVDICDENTEKVITSGVALVEADSETAKVSIDTDRVKMPEHFITKAVILDEQSNEVSSEDVDESNTQWDEDFSESKVSN